MDIFATAQELQVWLRTNYPKEDERHEWKEWRSLKSNSSGRKGDDWCWRTTKLGSVMATA